MMFKPLTFPRYHGAWTTTIRCNKEIPKICYILESWPNYWNIMDFEQCLFSIGYHICVSKILVISPYSKSLHIERTMHTFCTMWRTSTTATPKNRPKENIAWWRRKWLFKLLRSMSFFGFSKKNMCPFSLRQVISRGRGVQKIKHQTHYEWIFEAYSANSSFVEKWNGSPLEVFLKENS